MLGASQFGTITPTGGSWLGVPGVPNVTPQGATWGRTPAAPAGNAARGNNWGGFFQGLIGGAVQYYTQRDAEKRAAALKAQGQDYAPVQNPSGTWSVAPAPSFLSSPVGLVAVGGAALVAFMLIRGRR